MGRYFFKNGNRERQALVTHLGEGAFPCRHQKPTSSSLSPQLLPFHYFHSGLIHHHLCNGFLASPSLLLPWPAPVSSHRPPEPSAPLRSSPRTRITRGKLESSLSPSHPQGALNLPPLPSHTVPSECARLPHSFPLPGTFCLSFPTDLTQKTALHRLP